jgi:hypothetical protein
MAGDYWSKSYVLVHAKNVDVVILKLFVDKKPNVQAVTDAFSMSLTLQVLSADLVQNGKTVIDPIKVGPITVPLIGKAGDVNGAFTSWAALDQHQHVIQNATFENAHFVTFTLVGKASFDVPVAALPLPLPAKLLLESIVALLGGKITASIGTIHEVIPLH